jgi:hypothetical protein
MWWISKFYRQVSVMKIACLISFLSNYLFLNNLINYKGKKESIRQAACKINIDKIRLGDLHRGLEHIKNH